MQYNAATILLRFASSSNALQVGVATVNHTAPAFTTATAALSGGLTGNFTAYNMSDGTREMLVRTTITGTTRQIEIAPYSATPVWSTVVTANNGETPAGLAICADGTATGAAASVGTNGMQLIASYLAEKE